MSYPDLLTAFLLPPMKPFKLVVFDLAGTTVKDVNAVGLCMQEAIAEVGVNISLDEVNQVMGMPKPIAIRVLLDRAGVDVDHLAVHEWFRHLMIGFYKTSALVCEIPQALAKPSKLFGKRELLLPLTLDLIARRPKFCSTECLGMA